MAIIKSLYTPVKKDSPIQAILDKTQAKLLDEYKRKLRDKELKNTKHEKEK